VTRPACEPARCVVCGHTDATLIADAEAIRVERELLWEYHDQRLRPATPPERLMDRVTFSEPPPFALVRCRECGLVYRSPMERGRDVVEMYRRERQPPEVLRTLYETQRKTMRARARRLRRILGRGGSGLEIGSYVGAFLAAARECALQVEGLDVNVGVNEFARSFGFTVHDGEVTTFAVDRTFDTIAIWNTFDQLAEPRAVVHAAHRLLGPDGVLAIRVPNGAFYAAVRPSLTHRLSVIRSAARALMAQNNLLGFPYRFGFTAPSLARLLSAAGFRVQSVRGDVLVPMADEWTRPWARHEELLMKRVTAALVRRAPRRAPWLEIYARRV